MLAARSRRGPPDASVTIRGGCSGTLANLMVTSDWEDSPLDAPPEPAAAELPSVVAVLVTEDPDERFDAAMASLAAQDYPSLTVLVVDAGARDDLAPRIADVLPQAFIRTLDQPTTFAAAANEALAAVEGANYLLFCADDVELAEDTVSLLVEEAVRSNAGVVGPKFVDADRPDVLLEVGLGADKLGVPSPLVEAGELDHEQYDAVRDVFALPVATLLIRADLWTELEGFESSFGDDVAEIDLCWRVRLAGARALVVPDAVVRRPWTALTERFGPDPDAARRGEPKTRLRMLIRNYSGVSLLRVLPQAAAVAAFQAVALAVMGRGRRSWAVVSAWFWNLRHLGSTLRERRVRQAVRAVPDSDVRSLQIRGFSYVRAFLAGQLDLGTRVETLSGAGRDFAENVSAGARRPRIIFGAVLAALVILGSRDLITGEVPVVGTFLPWPGVSESWREFTSSWRYVWVGANGPAPTGLAFLSAAAAAALGAADFARTAAIVAAIPLGSYGAYRLVLPLSASMWSPLAAATAYAVVPLPRNALAEGRLGPLVFYALAPFMVERVLRASGIEPYGDPGGGRPPRDRVRALLALAVLVALAVAFFPPAAVLVPWAALSLVFAAPLAGGHLASWRAVVVAVVGSAVGVALLFPWSIGLVLPTPDLDVLGFGYRETPRLADVLLFDTGPARVGVGWILLALAAHPLVVGSGTRLRWVTRGWALAVFGWAAAWLPGRLDLGMGRALVEGPLVLAALGIAVAVGLGSGVLREELQRTRLSWRQGLSVLALVALVVVAFPLVGDAVEGRWHLPRRDWHDELTWMDSETAKGGFRVLWVGDPTLLPAQPLTLDDGTGFAVTRNGPGDVQALWPEAASGPTAHVADGLDAALGGSTDRLGHVLSPLAVRYLAYPVARVPGRVGTAEPPPETPLGRALARQVDLKRLSVDPGLILYENDAWLPAGALLPLDRAEELADGNRADAVRLDLDALRPVGDLPRGPEVQLSDEQRDQTEGIFLVAEAFDDDWEAVNNQALRPHFEVLGLVNGFAVEDVDQVKVEPGGQALRYGALGVEAVIWALVVGVWWRRRASERAADRRWAASLRDVRPVTTERPVPRAKVGA